MGREREGRGEREGGRRGEPQRRKGGVVFADVLEPQVAAKCLSSILQYLLYWCVQCIDGREVIFFSFSIFCK